MSIAIDQNACIGCGKCHDVCPGTLIHLNADRKAFIKYPKDCWGCTSCLKECPVHAIRFIWGQIWAVRAVWYILKKRYLRWIVERTDGTTTETV
ncbi:MAG: ferredoxin family protein [Ruminococcus sp.]